MDLSSDILLAEKSNSFYACVFGFFFSFLFEETKRRHFYAQRNSTCALLSAEFLVQGDELVCQEERDVTRPGTSGECWGLSSVNTRHFTCKFTIFPRLATEERIAG